MRTLLAKLHRYCVREKGHLLVGGGYLLTLAWGGHNSVLMAGAYGAAALMATHKIYRDDERESRGRHEARHLARD